MADLLQTVSIFLFSLWKTYVGPVLAATFGFGYLPMLRLNAAAVLAGT